MNCCCMAGSARMRLIIQWALWTGHCVCASCKKFHLGWLLLASSYNAVYGMGGIWLYGCMHNWPNISCAAVTNPWMNL
jgi:hypothetical protein